MEHALHGLASVQQTESALSRISSRSQGIFRVYSTFLTNLGHIRHMSLQHGFRQCVRCLIVVIFFYVGTVAI